MSSKFGLDHINVSFIRAFYDNNSSTKVIESANLLQYETQHFGCKVKLHLNESIAHRHWSIGLIQACDKMYLENKYGETGSSFWEFHPLGKERHTMVNDSDGRQYPFYSLANSKYEITRGIVPDCVINLQYEDHFYPTVAWDLPYCGGVKLTEVIRRQDFWVWLVAIKRSSSSSSSSSSPPMNNNNSPEFFHIQKDQLYVLGTIRWRYNLHMTFDPHMPIGKRLQMLNDKQDELPYVMEYDRSVPISAITPPHCNSAQSLLWYPKSKLEKPKILVPPRQIIVPWERWLLDMVPSRTLIVQKPKDCKLVGEWSVDHDVGISGRKLSTLYEMSHTRQQQQQQQITGTTTTTTTTTNSTTTGHNENCIKRRCSLHAMNAYRRYVEEQCANV